MHAQYIQTVNEGKVAFTDVEDGLKAKTNTIFENIKAFFRQMHVQQDQANNIGRHSMKAHQRQGGLNRLPLREKHSLGLYHLMD